MDNSKGVFAVVATAVAIILVLPFGIFFLVSSEQASLDRCLDFSQSGTVTGIPDRVGNFSGDQLENAAHIIRAGSDLGLGSRDQTIGIMTAIGESSLRVLDYGDAVGPDSRGLFQQRDQGWGSYQDRMDPYVSATNFFVALQRIENRDSMEPTLVANRVQINADPWHYERFWVPAQQIFTALTGSPGNPAESPSLNSGSDRYNLGPVQPHVAHAANLLGTMFNVETIGGHRIGNSYDLSGHQAGLAIDLMVPMTSVGRAQGQAIADYALANADALGVRYIIWYQQIWSVERASEGWRNMADRGSPSANHLDHPHISFYGADDLDGIPTSPLPVECGTGAPGGVPLAAGEWTEPSPGRISSPYGMRRHPVTGEYRLHSGTDYAAPCGDPIVAAGAGTVVSVRPNIAYGTLLTIDHGDETLSRYAHMTASGVHVRPGQQVLPGQHIADIGTEGYSTGCHLHFEIKVSGEFVNPTSFLERQSGQS